MPKYIVFTDLQASEGYRMCKRDPSLPLQRYRVNKFLDDLDEMCIKFGADGIIDLGDTSDDRSSLPIPTINQIARLGSDSRGFIKIIGNHEQYRKDQSIHTGKMFKSWNVVESNAIYDIDGCRILASAYSEDLRSVNNWLEIQIAKAPKDMPIVVLGHWSVVGASTASGIMLDGIPKETLEKAQLTLLGHIHKPQKIGTNIYYVGSPFQQDYGEARESKRVGLLDLDKGSVSFSWISMRGYPVYRVYTVSQFEAEALKDGHEEDIITVIVNNQEELALLEYIPGSAYVEKKLLYGEKMALNTRASVSNMMSSTRDLLKAYVARQPLALNNMLSNDELVEAGMELFEA